MKIIKAVFIIILLAFSVNYATASTPGKSSFKTGNGQFLLNGEPFIIKAAELHYPRIPKEYWDHRIKLTKALGINTVCLYTFWNAHEPVEGEFDFSGQNDIREFIKLCEANGMNVILRPGPYVCAEWEMGGLPWWLLKKKDIRLRENDPYFLEKVEKFQEALAMEVGDLTIDNGGPILMIQVENEYGAYGEDKDYIRNIRDILRRHYGEDILMFQCDWSSNFTANGLDDLLWTMNFGTGADINSQFSQLKQLRPDSPLMCSEFWSGWFDKWGAAHETRDAQDMIAGIDEMLSKGISFSLYMTHGGTNWGHWAGANSPGYSPDVTSYDYDAPINESGQPTEKYWLLRNTLEKYLSHGDTLPEIPELINPISIERFSLKEVAPLAYNMPEPIKDSLIRPMEDYDMGFGSIQYSTHLPAVEEGTILEVSEPHDYAQVFVDGKLIGMLDRRNGDKEILLPGNKEGARLDILVEATGRINFGRAIKDHKGVTEYVALKNPKGNKVAEINDWEVFLIPDQLPFYESLNFLQMAALSEVFTERLPRGAYRGTFEVGSPSDTFIDFSSWGKGLVYINGHAIGRFWEIGPQQTLYVPGPWLKEGENEILIFDIIGPQKAEVEGLTYPILDSLNIKDNVAKETIDLNDLSYALSLSFPDGNGWKRRKFEKGIETRFIAIEPVETFDAEAPAIAEIYLLDENGNRIDRETMTVTASSEDFSTGNNSAAKIIDLQESTYWRPDDSDKSPFVIIDLGTVKTVGGIEYLQRMETGAPGSVKSLKIYGSSELK